MGPSGAFCERGAVEPPAPAHLRGHHLAQRAGSVEAGPDPCFPAGRHDLVDVGVTQQLFGGLREIGLESQAVLGEDAEGVEAAVEAQHARARHTEHEPLKPGRMAEERCAERIQRFGNFGLIAVVDALEARLRDAVDIAEEHPVAGQAAPILLPEDGEGARDLSLDTVDMGGIVRVDRGDDMDALGPVVRRSPALGRAFADVAELHGALRHALGELGREGRKRVRRRAERLEPVVGQADVEARVRLPALRRLAPPLLGLGRDGGDVSAAARSRGAEKSARGCAVGDPEQEMAHAFALVSAQDVALKVARVEGAAHQPAPIFWRICGAVKPG